MDKERYFLITDANSVDKLNAFLENLERDEIKYETEYDTTVKYGILVTVDFED